MPVSVGETFAGFTILRVLGAGGMGTVYLAAHPRLPRQDALKVLAAQWTADPEYRERFLREADLTASLSHPNILGVHDRGEHDGQLWISMDYVGGTDASKLVREHHPQGLPRQSSARRSSPPSPRRWITRTNRVCCTEISNRPTSCWIRRRSESFWPTSALPGSSTTRRA